MILFYKSFFCFVYIPNRCIDELEISTEILLLLLSLCIFTVFRSIGNNYYELLFHTQMIRAQVFVRRFYRGQDHHSHPMSSYQYFRYVINLKKKLILMVHLRVLFIKLGNIYVK